MQEGLGRRWLSTLFARVHPRTQMPLLLTATVTAGALLFALALPLPLVTLAKLTGFVVLIVFVLVNLPLIRIKRRGEPTVGIPTFPIRVLYGGLLLSLLLFGFQAFDAMR